MCCLGLLLSGQLAHYVFNSVQLTSLLLQFLSFLDSQVRIPLALLTIPLSLSLLLLLPRRRGSGLVAQGVYAHVLILRILVFVVSAGVLRTMLRLQARLAMPLVRDRVRSCCRSDLVAESMTFILMLIKCIPH